MNIQYYGDYCFKLTVKPGGRATDDVVLWMDPPNALSGLRSAQGQADLVFVSHSDSDGNEALSGLRGETVFFRDPGEYAAKGVNIAGIASFQDEQSGSLRGSNTIFSLHTEGLSVCFLGALGHELSPAQVEKIGMTDILFLPVGSRNTLTVKKLDELVRKIEPAMVIPMHYALDGANIDADDLKVFCDEFGTCPSEAVQKLSVKKKDLEGKNMEIVVFEKS